MKKLIPVFFWQNKGISAGIFSILIFILFRVFPWLCENLYSRFIFQGFRYLWDDSFGLIPLPFIFIFLPFFAGWIIIRIVRRKKGAGLSYKIFFLNLASFLGWVTTSFFWFWGFNYARPELKDSLGIRIPSVEQAMLESEIRMTATAVDKNLEMLFNQKAEFLPAMMGIEKSGFQPEDQDSMLDFLKKNANLFLSISINELDFPFAGHPRAWLAKPDGIMYHLSCTGIYIPFFGEAYVESAQHLTEIPFTYFHELAHACGIANEGDANFIAWYACEKSEIPFWQLSARMEYLDYLLSDLLRSDEASLRAIKTDLSFEISEIRKRRKLARERYAAWFPGFQRVFYNFYLNSVGVEGGIQSYNHLVGMVLGWKLKHPDA